MVHLTVTPRIQDALAVVVDDDDHPAITTLYDGAAIDHRDLHRLSQLLSSPPASGSTDANAGTRYSFAALVSGTQIYHPPPPPPPAKSPEYIALMARLRREAENREYHSLTAQSGQDEEEMTWTEVKSQVTTIFNVLLSTIATAGAVWKVAEGWDAPERLAMAMLTAIVVCVAEVVLFWGFVRRVDEGSLGRKGKKGNARKEREKMEIVGSWEIGGKDKTG